MADSDILTPAEAADLLGIHPVTLRRAADRGDLPFIRTPGGHRRYHRVDVLPLKAETAAGAA